MSAAGGVSVVLCTHDGHSKGFLDTTLRSVLGQSAPPAEVIVVDDASTDGTADHVRRTYPHVRVVASARPGLAAARNTGVAAARGRWIAFVDDDDVWRPGKLAEQLRQIDASGEADATIWAARMVYVDGSGRIARASVPIDHLAQWPACLLGSVVAPSGAMLARALFDRFGGFNESLAEASAYEFWIRCLAGGATVRFTDDVALEYRRHGRQMTASPRTVELMLACDAFIRPHLQTLPAATAGRLRTARVLTLYRSFALRLGVRGAAGYWRRTPLRPLRMDWRAGAYPLLDAAAHVLPARLGAVVRHVAVRTVNGRPPPPSSSD
jgi:glycosyltransferase involved in cell wall biosynthesis